MGLMVDSNVFIRFEKSGKPIDFSSWENSEKVFISAIVVSELLSGVHRADTGHRCTGFHNSGGPRSCGHLCRLGKEGRNDRRT